MLKKRTWSQHEAENKYGELGIIESISLRNFMCHDNLSFDFDPHMNIIVGRNGSGKSAILTGIILALGGKSGATGRYSNIKGFIKSGKHTASVSVTLKNCGENAYKPDEFGKKITVERHFTSEGNSHYKLKSQGGRILSTSKEELSNILTVMDIQIDNPISVLTQETSRSFLVSKAAKPDKLFTLFYKGTGLSKIEEDYTRTLQDEKEMRSELEYKKSILPEMEKDIKKFKSILDKSTKVTELKKELSWAIIIELEQRRDQAKAEFEKKRSEYSDWQNKLNNTEAKLAKVQQDIATIKADKTRLNDKMASSRHDLQELTQKQSALSSEIREIKGEYLRRERQLLSFNTDISNMEKLINDIKKKNQNELYEEKKSHEMFVNQLRNDTGHTKSRIAQFESEKNSLRESVSNMEKKLNNCQAELQEIRYRKSDVVREKNQLKDGLANRINVFGQEMVNVLKDIKRAVQSRLFKVEPKGPIGNYINVRNPDWTFAVQECLKSGFLRTFLCDNHSDADQLTKIFNKHFQRSRPSIITTKFTSQLYDVTPNKTVCDHPTLLDMLDIADPVITNCLIDQHQIENIILISDERKASNLMLYNPPHMCRFAYTMNGDQYCHSPYRNYSCRNKNQICMLKIVHEEDIRRKDAEHQFLSAEESKKLTEKDTLVQQLGQNEEEINRIDNNITDLKIALTGLVRQLADTEDSYVEPKNISGLQSDLEKLQNDQKDTEEKFFSAKTLYSDKAEEYDSFKTKITESERILKEDREKFKTLSMQVDQYESKKECLVDTIEKIKTKLNNKEPDMKKMEKELTNAEATVKIAISNATVTDRINTNRSSDTIRQILEETEKFMQKQRDYDRDTVLKKYEEKVQGFNKKRAELKNLQEIDRKLKRMVESRFEALRIVCNNTYIRLMCVFTGLLKENNFQGYPKVDFINRTLNIFAQPKKTGSKPDDCPNLSQLSGGERSYITIAFLLSLWEQLNMPFRILDEYDVFMDSNNRHLTLNLLVNTAKSRTKVQYIFLSPQELPNVENSDHIKVHKMPAPRK